VERALPFDREALQRLRQVRPDVIAVSPVVDFGSNQIDYLRAARALSIPAAVCVASWDNLTTKGLLRGDSNSVAVWNEMQRREAIELHGVRPSRIVITGAPRFDVWFDAPVRIGPRELRRAAGLDASRQHLLYLCSSSFITPEEVSFVREWGRAIRRSADPAVSRAGLLVRPHPQHARQWSAVDLSTLGNAAVWPPAGAEAVDGAQSALHASIAHASAVVGVNTSAQIEACILEKPVLTVNCDVFARGQTRSLHYQYLRRQAGGFLWEAPSLCEHVKQLGAALAGRLTDERRRDRFVGSFVRPFGLDVPATPRLVDHLERLTRPGTRS
jgi:hypothetical protein